MIKQLTATFRCYLYISLFFMASAPLSLQAKDEIDPRITSTPVKTAAPTEKSLPPMDDFTDDEDIITVNDPFEAFNRSMFNFNDKAYFYVLKPVAKAYGKVVPEKGRISIKNFFTNLLAPVRIINSAFQLKGEDATNEFVRFMVNTTIGFGGFFDVAKTDFGIPIKKEDFGQTLGHYDVGNGPYLVIPFLGPSTLRDGFGIIVDGVALDPSGEIFEDETWEYIAAKLLQIENDLSLDKDTYEALKKDSIDPYIFIRNAYIQFRQGAVEK